MRWADFKLHGGKWIGNGSGPEATGIPQVERSHVRILWHHAFYDSFISGLLVYKGEKFWFDLVDETYAWPGDPEYPGWWRRYALIRLNPKDLDELEQRHSLFREMVGEHTDYDEAGNRRIDGQVRPEALRMKYYDLPKPPLPVLDENEVVAWFQRE